MNKRAIIVHQWSGSPTSDWYPWIKKKLEMREYDVLLPVMPITDAPQINPWIHELKNVIGDVKNSDILIGHSIGCQTILRYLEKLSDNENVDKVILVAPWYMLKNLSSPQAEEIAKPWIETPINFEKVKQKANEFITIFSDNDKFVPYEETKKYFQEKLNTRIITEHNRGHLTQDDNVIELPILLSFI